MIRRLPLIIALAYFSAAGTSLACGTTRRTRAASPPPAPTSAVLLNYENARLALIDGSISDVRLAAKGIASAADRVGDRTVAGRAAALEDARDLAAAREAFAALSDQIIDEGAGGVAVAWCPIAKKSWLQPDGRISNPYVDEEMRHCGEFVEPGNGTTNRATSHHH